MTVATPFKFLHILDPVNIFKIRVNPFSTNFSAANYFYNLSADGNHIK